jgi:hypothetical protein
MATTQPGSQHTLTSAAEALLADSSLLDDIDTQPEQDDADDEALEVQGEAEDETETVEAEAETDDDEEQDAGEQEPEEPRYTVKVDGEEVEVSLDELRSGYSRQTDYTRKTQELARQRKEIEQEVQAAREAREWYQKQLAELQSMPQEQEPTKEQWDALERNDPVEWVRQKELARERRERKQQVISEQQRILQQQQQEQAQLLQQTLIENQKKLLETIPEWTNPEVASKERTAIKRYAQDVGFAEEELGQVYDHRLVHVLRDAMRYRQMMTKKADIKPTQGKAPKTAPPGTASTPAEQKSVSTRKLYERLKATGSRKDAARLMESMLD